MVTKLLIELNKNKLDVDEEEYNSKKYDIKFSEKVGRLSPTQFEVRNILQPKFQEEESRKKAMKAITNVSTDSFKGVCEKQFLKNCITRYSWRS